MTLQILLIIMLGILLILVTGWAINRYRIARWQHKLFRHENPSEKITEEDLASLPRLMKNYLQKVGVIGRSRYAGLSFKQSGTIRSGSNKKWLSFKANQYMSLKHGGFVWSARSFPLYITDSYFRGIGKVRVNLLGLANLAVFSNQETNQSALGRYFGELIWFPVGFLNEAIEWEAVDDATIKGTLTMDGISFVAHFHFTEDGLIYSFTGKRYRDLAMEDFRGKAENYVEMDGLLIPKEMTAIWELKSGPLEYFNASIKAYKLKE